MDTTAQVCAETQPTESAGDKTHPTCPNCTTLQREIENLKSEMLFKEAELKKAEAKLLKTEKQLKRSTDISDKLLLKIQKFSTIKQITNSNGDSIAGQKTSLNRNKENVCEKKAVDEFGVDGSTPTVQTPNQPDQPPLQQQTSTSLADELKSVAQSVCDQQGYVFDQRTGMYYDYGSGYYYDNEQSLFFDPASGTYFYYDAESQEYKFHSQVDVTKLYARRDEQNKALRTQRNQQSNNRTQRRRREDVEGEGKSSDRKHSRHQKKKKKKEKRKKRKRTKYESDDEDFDRHRKSKKRKHKKSRTREKQTMQEPPPPEGELVIDEDEPMEGANTECSNEHSDPSARTDRPMSDVDREEGELSDVDALSSISAESLRTPSSLSDVSTSSSSSSESESSDDSESEDGVPEKSKADEWEEFCTQSYAPCIRAMVMESEMLTAGSLHVITTSGGTIGRENGLGHVVVIQDPLISKMHCEFLYDSELKKYTVTDHASQNGTMVNGQRIGEAKVKSEPRILQHCDELQLGGTKLCLHIHPGRETCDTCEPGLVQARLVAESAETATPEIAISKADRETARRKQLKNIRRKFGLEKEPYTAETTNLASGYSDKAEERRRVKGSDNPYQRDDPGASVHRAITSENKGHKLLAKMGWSEGQSLGKSADGIKEPINVAVRAAGSGLGSAAATSSLDTSHQSRQQFERRLKTQIRFAQIDRTRKVEEKPACFVSAGVEDGGDEIGPS